MMPNTYIDELESIVEEVSDWAVELVTYITNVINPSGRPFGSVEQSDTERIKAYQEIRGDTSKWAAFIDENAKKLIESLSQSGVSPDFLASVHPYDIAEKYAITYSAEMEQLITENV